MHIPRFFLTSDDVRPAPEAAAALDLQPGQSCEITNAAVINQVKNVLRLRQGDTIQILNGSGLMFDCRLTAAAGKTVSCLVAERVQLPESSVHVCVALSMLKGERFDWALQKLTELGVQTIVPLLTSRTVVKLDFADAKGTAAKLLRWQAIVREAAEQSERATIPHIVAPRNFRDFVAEIAEITHGGTSGSTFICAERIPAELLKDILLASDGPTNFIGTAGKTIQLVIGPEGGFSEEEIELARNRGVKPVSLGPRILRSETAAIYALAQVIWCLEK